MQKSLTLFIFLISIVAYSEVQPTDLAVLVNSMVRTTDDIQKPFAEKICSRIAEQFSNGKSGARILCLVRPEEFNEVRLSSSYKLGLQLTENVNRSWTLAIENWKPIDDTDFDKVEWTIAPDASGPRIPRPSHRRFTEELSQENTFVRLLNRFISFQEQQPNFRKWTLATVTNSSSSRIRYQEETRTFLDGHSGRIVSTAEAYDIFKNESLKQRYFLRTVNEVSVILGSQALSYYAVAAFQDLDYSAKEAFPKILTAGKWRMDDNPWFYNNIGHPITGMWVHQSARNNGFGPLESFLVGLTSSSFWEIVVEFREKISINDLIVTPVAGSIMGEVMHQFQRAFTQGRNTKANRILGRIFNTPAALSNLFYKKRPFRSESINEYGFADDFMRNFDIFSMATGNGSAQVGIQGEIIKIENYGQSGESLEILSDVPIAEILLQAGLDYKGQADFLWYFKTALKALHKKNVEVGPSGTKGYELLIAPSHAFKMDILNTQGGTAPSDMVATASLIGGTVDLTVFIGKTVVRAVVDIFGDFSAIRSMSFADYQKSNSTDGVSQLLVAENYYFGWGMTQAKRIQVQRGRFDLGAIHDRTQVSSIGGLARWQENVTRDFKFKDSRSNTDLWVGFRPNPESRWHVSTGLLHREWISQMPEIKQNLNGNRTRIYTKIRFSF